MEIMAWKDEYSVKIATIDKQHQQLFKILNEFYDGIHHGAAKEKMLSVIKSLEDYTVYHFSSEEYIMKQHKFAGFEKHKAEHDAFIEKVLEFKDRYTHGRLLLSLEVTKFIKEWICTHIMQTDHQYSDYLIKKGVI